MEKVVHIGSWRLQRSSVNDRSIWVKGQGRTITIDYGDMLHPFFEQLLEMGQLPWPFVESPGDFSTRLENALKEFPLLGAVRNVLIENPPLIIYSTPSAREERWFERFVHGNTEEHPSCPLCNYDGIWGGASDESRVEMLTDLLEFADAPVLEAPIQEIAALEPKRLSKPDSHSRGYGGYPKG